MLGLTVAVTGVTSCNSADTDDSKINILWLFGEDVDPWMGPFGDSTVATPNIDFLAENGVTFTHCYSVSGVSSATRSALATGVMATTIGVHNHRSGRTYGAPAHLPDYVQILPQIMRKNGYFTYNYGKDDFNWQYNWRDYWAGDFEETWYDKCGLEISWEDRKDKTQPFFGEIELKGGKFNLGKGDITKLVDTSKIRVPSYYPNIPSTKLNMAHHYAQIMATDKSIGEVLDKMKKDPKVYKNTIVIFFSDNGWAGILRDKQFLYDGGIHMPLIISAPGNPKLLKQKGVRDDLVSLLDLTATTLKLAGIDIPDYYESKDLFAPDYHRDYVVAAKDRCDFTIDRVRAIRTLDFKYIRNFMTDRALMQPSYRDKKQSYKDFMALYKSGKVKFEDAWLSPVRVPEELYDLHADPDETHNLANNPKYKDELIKMRERLDTWIKETGDQGQYPESEAALQVVYDHWGVRSVNPEYDRVKNKTKRTKKAHKK